MEYTKINIYCPRCGRKVGAYDVKATIPFIGSCRNCRKRVVYNTDTKEVAIKDIPPRNTSSGRAF